MILEYIRGDMKRARYEIVDDEEPHYGEIPGIKGLWATGKTLAECRLNLKKSLEDWILFSVSKQMELPLLC